MGRCKMNCFFFKKEKYIRYMGCVYGYNALFLEFSPLLIWKTDGIKLGILTKLYQLIG
jgi:hypothetical protein